MAGHMTLACAIIARKNIALRQWKHEGTLEKHDDLTPEQIHHLRQHFELVDQNCDGAITFIELSRLLLNLGAGRFSGTPLCLGIGWLRSFGPQNTETVNFQQLLEVVLNHNDREDLFRTLAEYEEDYGLDLEDLKDTQRNMDMVEAAANVNDEAPSQAVCGPPNGLVDAAIEDMQDEHGNVDNKDQDPKNGPYPSPSLLPVTAPVSVPQIYALADSSALNALKAPRALKTTKGPEAVKTRWAQRVLRAFGATPGLLGLLEEVQNMLRKCMLP